MRAQFPRCSTSSRPRRHGADDGDGLSGDRWPMVRPRSACSRRHSELDSERLGAFGSGSRRSMPQVPRRPRESASGAGHRCDVPTEPASVTRHGPTSPCRGRVPIEVGPLARERYRRSLLPDACLRTRILSGALRCGPARTCRCPHRCRAEGRPSLAANPHSENAERCAGCARRWVDRQGGLRSCEPCAWRRRRLNSTGDDVSSATVWGDAVTFEQMWKRPGEVGRDAEWRISPTCVRVRRARVCAVVRRAATRRELTVNGTATEPAGVVAAARVTRATRSSPAATSTPYPTAALRRPS